MFVCGSQRLATLLAWIVMVSLCHDACANEAEQVFESLYGEKMRNVRATADRSDDTALAQELIQVARSSSNTPRLLTVLCENADQLASASADGYGVAIEASLLIAEHVPDQRPEALDRISILRQRQFIRANAQDRSVIGEELIDVLITLAQAKREAGEFNDSEERLRRALAVSSAITSERKVEIEDTLRQLQWAQKAQSLEQRIKADANDSDAAKQLVKIYVAEMDMPKKAATLFANVEDEQLRQDLQSLGKGVDALTEDEAMRLGDWYSELVSEAAPEMKQKLVGHAQLFYARFLELHPADDVMRKKAELALKALEARLAHGPVSRPERRGRLTPGLQLTGDQEDVVLLLRASSRPHRVADTYRVPAGKRLEIEAGAIIECMPGSRILIQGELRVSGTEQQPVIIRGTQRGFGTWKSLRLEEAGEVTLDHLHISDANTGISMTKSSATMTDCQVLGNVTGIYVGDIGLSSSAKLVNCVVLFNKGNGIKVSGSKASFDSCTISKNGGVGFTADYYPSFQMTNTMVVLNEGGGVHGELYESRDVKFDGCVLAGNKSFDAKNETGINWTARKVYWGPDATKVLKARPGASLPNILGSISREDNLESMPESCGASVRKIGSLSLW